jgi:hypothetical protein
MFSAINGVGIPKYQPPGPEHDCAVVQDNERSQYDADAVEKCDALVREWGE